MTTAEHDGRCLADAPQEQLLFRRTADRHEWAEPPASPNWQVPTEPAQYSPLGRCVEAGAPVDPRRARPNRSSGSVTTSNTRSHRASAPHSWRADVYRAADLLMGLHNRQTLDNYQLSPSGRQILAVVEGAGEPLEPSVIAERLLITTGSGDPTSTTRKSKAASIRQLSSDLSGDRSAILIDIRSGASNDHRRTAPFCPSVCTRNATKRWSGLVSLKE